MTALSEISKQGSVSKRRGPALTPEQQAEQKRQRTQARVGLASNALGLSAGAAATGAALRDPRFGEEGAGKVANWVHRQGGKIPTPIENWGKKLKPKHAALMAGGALALQAGNIGGDVVANRVLSRSAKQGQKPVKKGLNLGKLIGTGKITRKKFPAHEFDDAFSSGSARGLHNEGGWGVRQGYRNKAKGKILVGEESDAPPLPELREVPAVVRQRLGGGLTPAGKAVYVGGPAVAATGGAVAVHNKRKVKKDDGERMLDAYISKADHTGGHGSIEKAYRRYDPEADRQRRLGLAAGGGLLGAGLLGQQAAKKYTLGVHGPEGKAGGRLKGIAVKPQKGRAATLLTLGALGSGALGVGAYRRGVSERNNPWN